MANMKRLWILKATCKHRECGHSFPVSRDADRPRLFDTEEEAVIALKEEKLRDIKLPAYITQKVVGDLMGKMTNAPTTPPRMLKCPRCDRTAIFTAEELYIELAGDFLGRNGES